MAFLTAVMKPLPNCIIKACKANDETDTHYKALIAEADTDQPEYQARYATP